MQVEETEFKGRPTLTIRFDDNDPYPFSFGIGKAKKILGSLDKIKAFVEKHDKPRPEAKSAETTEKIPQESAPAPEVSDKTEAAGPTEDDQDPDEQ